MKEEIKFQEIQVTKNESRLSLIYPYNYNPDSGSFQIRIEVNANGAMNNKHVYLPRMNEEHIDLLIAALSKVRDNIK
jgi:hypothetical protein